MQYSLTVIPISLCSLWDEYSWGVHVVGTLPETISSSLRCQGSVSISTQRRCTTWRHSACQQEPLPGHGLGKEASPSTTGLSPASCREDPLPPLGVSKWTRRRCTQWLVVLALSWESREMIWTWELLDWFLILTVLEMPKLHLETRKLVGL